MRGINVIIIIIIIIIIDQATRQEARQSARAVRSSNRTALITAERTATRKSLRAARRSFILATFSSECHEVQFAVTRQAFLLNARRSSSFYVAALCSVLRHMYVFTRRLSVINRRIRVRQAPVQFIVAVAPEAVWQVRRVPYQSEIWHGGAIPIR